MLHLENDHRDFNLHLKERSKVIKINSMVIDGKMMNQIDLTPKELTAFDKTRFL